MSEKEYIKQLEEENAALKKKLEEKPVEVYRNSILNLKSLSDITEENPLVILDDKNKPKYKLVSAYRNKKNGYVVMKIQMKRGWFGSHTYKEVQNFWNDTVAFPVSSGDFSTDKSQGLITYEHSEVAQGFFRMLESVGLVDRKDNRVGM